MIDIAVILVSAAIFLAIILGLAVNPDHREKWVGMTFMIAACGGICMYGACNAHEEVSFSVAIFRTVVDVGKMFSGANNVGSFQKFAGDSALLMTLFWAFHFLAYYSMASAIIMTIAKSTLKKVRSWFLRINDVDLIYGLSDNSIAYGRNLSGKKRTSIVFVGSDSGSREAEIRQIGALLYSDEVAMDPSAAFLKRLRVSKGKSRFRLNALSPNIDSNIAYAAKMMDCLEKAGVHPQQTELVLLGKEEISGTWLQALDDHYGYGTVRVFDRPELIARLLMQEYPICNAITFDKNGRATCDTDILLVGFGRKGQEVLKKLVLSGQFEGSAFRVTVFDAGSKDTDGFFASKCPKLLDNYDITFMQHDGRSRAFIEYLKENVTKLKYIVIAVGDEKAGREICMGILDYMNEYGLKTPIYQCLKDSIIRYSTDQIPKKHDIYDTDVLYGGKLDELAKKLNHYYCKTTETVEESWARCNYFNRMSSRASADFLSTYLKRLGFKADSEITPETMEILARTEHLRWCAFHYAFGYDCMPKKTLKERAKQYKKDHSIRITRDVKSKLHACLIPWESLDDLSAFEKEVTGRDVDYKQMDRDNVNVILDLMED